MKHPREYRGEQVVILGLARSGVAVAKLFHELGAVVTVNDKKERTLCPEADELTALGISVICGSHPSGLIHEEVQLVVKNPGIPYSIDPIEQAQRLGIEIVTEVEVASWITQAPMIGITGSNGKTTTTTWIGLMLDKAGLQPIVAGNIGRALTEAALEATKDQMLVVELSSFQLKGTVNFRPRIACLLNVYETHLDYHGTIEDYVTSKAKLFANQTSEDTAVLNWDDPVCRKLAGQVNASVLPFSLKEELSYGVYVRPGWNAEARDGERSIVYRDQAGAIHTILAVDEIGIPGSMNVENALAASCAAITAGVPLETIAQVLREFRGVEHRLEHVATLNGVLFYNNSKSTNPTATIKTIESFGKGRKVVLIAGGLDRGSDYKELLPVFQEQVKGLVALGQTKEKIVHIATLAGMAQVKTVDTANNVQDMVMEAVREAAAMAEPGDIVLLSPACASWDMFSSYEERGSMFKQSVHNL